MSAPSLQKRIQIWEQGLDRLALEIENRGQEGEKLLPLFERVERELAADLQRQATLGSVNQRLQRLKDQKATQSSPTDRAAT
ncbi:MAG: hypothetical protein ACJAZW_002000 [Maritalea sp.]|jgi:hypothetical protein